MTTEELRQHINWNILMLYRQGAFWTLMVLLFASLKVGIVEPIILLSMPSLLAVAFELFSRWLWRREIKDA